MDIELNEKEEKPAEIHESVSCNLNGAVSSGLLFYYTFCEVLFDFKLRYASFLDYSRAHFLLWFVKWRMTRNR